MAHTLISISCAAKRYDGDYAGAEAGADYYDRREPATTTTSSAPSRM